MDFNPNIVDELFEKGYSLIPLNEKIIPLNQVIEMRKEILNAEESKNLRTEKSMNELMNQEIAEKHPETTKISEENKQNFENCFKYLKEISLKLNSMFSTL
jgi:histidyl-tRNA synthetase